MTSVNVEQYYHILTVLWGYNSHTRQFIHLKCTELYGFYSIHRLMQLSPQTVLEHSHHLKAKP